MNIIVVIYIYIYIYIYIIKFLRSIFFMTGSTRPRNEVATFAVRCDLFSTIVNDQL